MIGICANPRSPAKAGVQARCEGPIALPRGTILDWAPAFAGERGVR